MKHIVLKEETHVGKGKMPFFRLSKLSALQWSASVAAIIYSSMNLKENKKNSIILLTVACFLFLFFPVINEIILNFVANHCQKSEDINEVKEKFGN